MCIILESGRTHTHTDRQTLTSTHKSEQVVSTPSRTFNRIHPCGQRQCSAHHLPCNTVRNRLQRSGNFSAFSHTYSHFWPSCAFTRHRTERFVVKVTLRTDGEEQSWRGKAEFSLLVGCFLAGIWPDEQGGGGADETWALTLITSWPGANASCHKLDVLRGGQPSAQPCRHPWADRTKLLQNILTNSYRLPEHKVSSSSCCQGTKTHIFFCSCVIIAIRKNCEPNQIMDASYWID